jgi:hypothetical protein
VKRRASLAVALALAHARAASAQDEEPQPPAEPPPTEPEPSPTTTPQEVPPPPAPPRATRFGDAGQFVVTDSSALGVGLARRDANNYSVGIEISPGIDWFIVDRVSLGVDIDFTFSEAKISGRKTDTLSFASGPRVGYVIPLGEKWSLYPRLSVGVRSVHLLSGSASDQPTVAVAGGGQVATATDSQSVSSSATIGWLSLFAPFLYHAAPHFFVGAGPSLYHQFGKAPPLSSVAASDYTRLGARVVIGGWWGGESPPPAAAPAEPPRQFGRARQVVLTGETGASFAYAFRQGIHRSEVTFAPGADWFVADHLSIGGAFALTKISDSEDVTVTRANDYFAAAIGPRVGVEMTLSSSLSLYPRASVFVGDEESGGTGGTLLYFSLYAPLLLHIADHFFVGFGPYVSRDFVRYGTNNEEFRVGANLLVGGWL